MTKLEIFKQIVEAICYIGLPCILISMIDRRRYHENRWMEQRLIEQELSIKELDFTVAFLDKKVREIKTK